MAIHRDIATRPRAGAMAIRPRARPTADISAVGVEHRGSAHGSIHGTRCRSVDARSRSVDARSRCAPTHSMAEASSEGAEAAACAIRRAGANVVRARLARHY